MDNDDYSIIRGHPRHARHRGVLRPFEGWALDAAGVLDRASPGFLVHAFGASPRWRQAVFLTMAIGVVQQPDEFLLRASGEALETQQWTGVQREVAQDLMAMSPRQIVSAALGQIPEGLAGSLAKLGSQPMRNARDYLLLVELLTSTDAEQKLRAKVLLQVDRLDADLISAAREIDPIALIPGILMRVRDGLDSLRLNQSLAGIRLVSSQATDEALRQSLEDRAANFRSHDFAQAWLAKADRPPVVCAALDDHPDFESVTPATAANVGKEHRNCLGSKAQQLVTGVWGAWVWKPGPLIICATKCEEGLLLTGLYAPGNREVPREHARMVKALLNDLGIVTFTRCEPVEAVRPLTLGRFGDLDFDDFEID